MQLARSKGEYYATVSGTIIDADISKATSEIDKAIDKLDLPKGVTVDVAGVAADMTETFTQLIVAMLAAIAIVYFILVVTFREGVAPFAILFSLPFAVIGSFVGLLIAGETISVSVMMGLLMLIGIVVTNAIVLVDRIIRMERNGLKMREAILEAGATRLRPILMTAIATIGALIPLAIGSRRRWRLDLQRSWYYSNWWFNQFNGIDIDCRTNRLRDIIQAVQEKPY